MENNTCGCGHAEYKGHVSGAGEEGRKWHCRGKHWFVALGMILVSAIVIVSILRDSFVNNLENQMTFMGQGKVSYQPDIAIVVLGVQIDKAPTAEEALNQLNDKMTKVVAAVKALEIPEGDVQTQAYSLFPQYDYIEGITKASGYNANQQLSVKVRALDKNPELTSRVVSVASAAGANQVLGVTFDVSNANDLKQQARLAAIADAKSKTGDVVKSLGIRRLGKIVSWYENVIQAPGVSPYGYYGLGMGGEGGGKAVANPQVPAGTQEVIIEVGISYSVK